MPAAGTLQETRAEKQAEERKQIRRLLIACVLVAIVGYAGFEFGRDYKSALERFVNPGFLTAAILIGAGKAILDSVPSIFEFYRRKPFVELWRPLGAVFLAFFALGLASGLPGEHKENLMGFGPIAWYNRTEDVGCRGQVN